MAYKVAYISKNGKFDAASEFENFASSNGVRFVVEKFDTTAQKAFSAQALTSFDAVVLSSYLGAGDEFATSIAKSLSLYAKCVFKMQDSSVLTHSNLVIVTDAHRKSDGGFATDNEFGRYAHASLRYSELEIERTARTAYELAEKRSRLLTLSDAQDGSHVSALWRKITSDINEDYPSVHLEFESTFDTARKLAENGQTYDVILTKHSNADALSGVADACSPLGEGTSPVAYLGETTVGLYSTERALAGSRLFDALSFAKMLELSFDLPALSQEWAKQISKLLLQN